MAQIWCTNCKRVTFTYNKVTEKSWKLKCGCIVSSSDINKWCIHKRITYFLSDGTEIRFKKTIIKYELIKDKVKL